MALRQRLVNSLDELSTSRTSLSRRTRALESLEQLLAETTFQRRTLELDAFLKLQDNFDCNIASRVLHCVESAALVLEQSMNPVIVNDEDTVSEISRMVSQSLRVLQGVSLLHYPSKLFLGKKWCIQLFIDLLTMSRHLSPGIAPSETMSLLASSLIDTLLCVLVDAPASIRVFEEAGGVEVVVKTLKRAGVPRNIRIKCLEFLYFYLLDETSDIPAIKPRPLLENTSPVKQASRSPSPPRTPRKPRHLGLLHKELDFVPVTPKKVQVGVGMPQGKPGTGDLPPLPSSPTKRSREHRRTTQEKKDILASLLGNVDALVESVTKSGIWGLG